MGRRRRRPGGVLRVLDPRRRRVSLWLDLRAGSDPVELGGRELSAAVVRFVDGDAPFATQGALASALCHDPRPVGPLVGANNWYYAYGRGFDADAVVRDARTVAELVGEHPVRPFGVVDDGWSLDGTADGLPASGVPGGVAPLDWLHTSTPSLWQSGGETVRYEWMAEEGSDPFDATGDAVPPPPEG